MRPPSRFGILLPAMLRRTTCNRDCPDACGILATVEGNRVVRLQGDPDHPVTRGFLCYRTNRFLERQYDPDRIVEPQIRVGDGFRSASWEEALDLVAGRLASVRAESGPAAILNYRSGGSLGLMKSLTDHFFERFGPVTIKSGDICSGAGDAAQLLDFGDEDSHDLFDLLNARTILLWGKNPYVSNVHLLPVLRQAKGRGARLVMIDPVHHRGAELCERYFQPRPGGSIALAMGMMRGLIDSGRSDPQAASYCDHLEALTASVRRRSVEQWAALADVATSEMNELTELYADGPAAILVGWGMQRRTHGAATVRALDALGAISGNIGIPGGGVSFYFKRRGAFDLSFNGGLEVAPRAIPEAELGRGILEAADPPIRLVWISCGNPVAMLPDSDRVAEALRTREMTVVVDSHMTDSAREADVILPTTTMLEDHDILGAYGHHYLATLRPVVDAPSGVLTDYEIVQRLAARLGLAEEFRGDARDWQERMLARVAADGASLEALERGPVRNPRAARVLFADRRFPTASGKVNLIRDPDPEPPLPTAERPLLLMAISTEKAQASQTTAARQEGPATVTVHPDAAPGMASGDRVRLESTHGSLEVRLAFDDRQRRDVALMVKGGWYRRGRCANVLIPARQTDLGGGAAYYDTAVRLIAVEE